MPNGLNGFDAGPEAGRRRTLSLARVQAPDYLRPGDLNVVDRALSFPLRPIAILNTDNLPIAATIKRSPMPALTEELKTEIDAMSHLDICRTWRFARPDDPCVAGMAGDYLSRRIQSLGGFTPAISSQMG
jgi:hypothetical protein